MTIWVFGDSYATHYKHYPDTWLNILANKLNLKIKGYGKPLTTPSYCIAKFNSVKEQIKENDIVIVSLSSLYTSSVFSIGYSHVDLESLSHNKQTAYELYRDHLQFLDDFRTTYHINFLHHLNYFSKKRNLHTILLFTHSDTDEVYRPDPVDFPYLNLSIDNIHRVSRNEWTEEALNTKDVKCITFYDVRVNHLLKTNHTVLAKKILDNIVNKSPIDLTTDFKENVYDTDAINDIEFIENELFPSFVRGYKIERKMKNYVTNAVNKKIISKDKLISNLLNFMSDTELKIFLNAYHTDFYKRLLEKG